MNNHAKLSIKLILSCLSIAILYSCSSQKNNATNRGLQNLSARYNLIYNSNILLNSYQEDLSQTHKDNYDGLLAVYIAPPQLDYSSTASPATNSKTLDEITQKAQTIVAEKTLSNYIDEAYILLGKTNFYKGNYFTAVEYFDYTARAYKTNNKIKINALNWKVRSLMQLDNYQKAGAVLDTVSILLDSVNNEKAEPLATLAQFNIHENNYKKAIFYLEQAIKATNSMQSRTRWPFILAQLYEYEKKYDASLKNYTQVENSNAPFEMYFNAKLSKIRIYDLLNDQTSNRKQQLLKLLKDDKNFDYTDQIYYEVAEDYLEDKNFGKAEEYYKLSASKSTINQYQKGLSYLKLADLNFKNLGNYVNAKLYYDSAANTLPKTYPGYEAILKKGQNLEYLTQRYQTISQQDSLQFIAKLDEQDRTKRIDKMFEPKKEVTLAQKIVSNKISKINDPLKQQSGSAFYFSNASAIGTGFSDFKKRWGNRPLENNWRQSVKSAVQISSQNQLATISDTSATLNLQKNANLDKAEKIKAYTALLPLTQDQLNKSDQQIIDAYFEIAAFYQQVLNDEEEATKVYEILLARYPQNNHLDAIYYSLYLGYAKSDQAKSENYKNMVLAKYPGSVYAKTILDPNFSAKQNALDLEINKIYNTVFAHYEKKDFPTVIASVNEVGQRFPGNSLQAQYDYLKAISIGRTNNVDSLLSAFNQIITKYPNDQLINPLVKDHIAYITANLASYKARKIALIDFDGAEPRFIAQQEPTKIVKQENPIIAVKQEPAKIINPVIIEAKPVVPKTKTAETIIPATPPAQVIISTNTPITMPVAVDNLFTKTESGTYYYVIAVADVTVSVSSSRFGVGQFNRGNFSGTGLKHQLQELDEDQLIYVGNFATLSDAKSYYEGITPQLNKIMKVPASSYKGFFITKDNFDKIINRATLNRYIEFFKNNY